VLADQRGRLRNHDACILHGLDLAGSVSLALLDDGASVAHSPLGRCSEASDEANHGLVLLVVLLQPIAGDLLGLSSDLADHDDALSLGVDHKLLEDIDEVGSVEGVSSDADDGGLSEAGLGCLVDGLIGEGSGSADDADLAGLVDVSRHDADLALVGLDDSGTVGPDHSGLVLGAKGMLHLDHIVLRDSWVK
jgi:hypothetical protein